MTEPSVVLVASPDDYFLENAWTVERDALVERLGGAEVEVVPEGTPAVDVVMAVQSPSLFAENRVVVVRDAGRWFETRAKSKKSKKATEDGATDDPAPLVALLENGLPEGTALVLAAQVRSRPSGALADAVERAGRLHWIPLPDPPKPWEEGTLSRAQREVLERMLRKAAGGVRFERAAVELLLERLGFAPRDLVQEVEKLTSAVGEGGTVDEALVRRLVFPPEQSLEIVLDGLIRGDLSAVFGLVAGLEDGAIVRDWRGRRLDEGGLARALVSQVGRLLEQMLYLRRLAVQEGLAADLDPKVNGRDGWYSKRFKSGIGPRLVERIVADPASPFPRRSTSARPSVWHLHRVFRAAGRFQETAIIRTLAGMGAAERESRNATTALGAVTVVLETLAAGVVPLERNPDRMRR